MADEVPMETPGAGPEGAAEPQSPPAAEAADSPRTEADAAAAGLDLVLDVPVRLSVEVGGTQLLVREVLQLDKGSVIELDRNSGEPADVYVNGRLLARGDVTVVEDRLAIRLVEVVSRDGSTGPSR